MPLLTLASIWCVATMLTNCEALHTVFSSLLLLFFKYSSDHSVISVALTLDIVTSLR
jgi:hypothetical protein